MGRLPKLWETNYSKFLVKVTGNIVNDKEKLARLIEQIKIIVPYVTATISPNNAFGVERITGAADPNNTLDWMAIHKGRASSSMRQLEHLLHLVKEMKND